MTNLFQIYAISFFFSNKYNNTIECYNCQVEKNMEICKIKQFRQIFRYKEKQDSRTRKLSNSFPAIFERQVKICGVGGAEKTEGRV